MSHSIRIISPVTIITTTQRLRVLWRTGWWAFWTVSLMLSAKLRDSLWERTHARATWWISEWWRQSEFTWTVSFHGFKNTPLWRWYIEFFSMFQFLYCRSFTLLETPAINISHDSRCGVPLIVRRKVCLLIVQHTQVTGVSLPLIVNIKIYFQMSIFRGPSNQSTCSSRQLCTG